MTVPASSVNIECVEVYVALVSVAEFVLDVVVFTPKRFHISPSSLAITDQVRSFPYQNCGCPEDISAV